MDSRNANQGTSVAAVGRRGATCETVVVAVAEATCVDPLELEPLHTAVDPDALDRLFASPNGPRSPPLAVRFEMADCEVTVRRDGDGCVVVVTPTMDLDARTPTAQPAD